MHWHSEKYVWIDAQARLSSTFSGHRPFIDFILEILGL